MTTVPEEDDYDTRAIMIAQAEARAAQAAETEATPGPVERLRAKVAEMRTYEALSSALAAEEAAAQAFRNDVAARRKLKGPPKGNQHYPHWWESLVYRLEQRIDEQATALAAAEQQVAELRGEVKRKDDVIWACRTDGADLKAARDAAREEADKFCEALEAYSREVVRAAETAYGAVCLHASDVPSVILRLGVEKDAAREETASFKATCQSLQAQVEDLTRKWRQAVSRTNDAKNATRAAREETARVRELLHTGTWLRLDDGRTQLAVDMPPGADLSCRAYRDIAIDAALTPTPPLCQHQLLAEDGKCQHGLFFGTTCEQCILACPACWDECETASTFGPRPAQTEG